MAKEAYPFAQPDTTVPTQMAQNVVNTMKTTSQQKMSHFGPAMLVRAINQLIVQAETDARTIRHLVLNSLSWKDLDQIMTDFMIFPTRRCKLDQSKFMFSIQRSEWRETSVSGNFILNRNEAI